MNETTQDLPFTIRQGDGEALSLQVETGIARAIRSGIYEEGDRLPPIGDMARTLGISELPVRSAITRLVQSGDLCARRRVGIRVADRARRSWRAHALLVSLSNNPYYAVRDSAFAAEVEDVGVRFSSVFLRSLEDEDVLAKFRALLDSHTFDVVVLSGFASRLVAELVERAIRFVVFDHHTPSPLAAANLLSDYPASFMKMTAYARDCGVRTAVAIGPHPDYVAALEEAFSSVGIACEVMPRGTAACPPSYNTIEVDGYQTTERILRRGVRPDLIFFADDFAARGGLTALLAAGVHAPDDVQVITRSNRGICPVFPYDLTRLESDPAANGKAGAKFVARVLANRKQPADLPPLGMNLIVGQTTRDGVK